MKSMRLSGKLVLSRLLLVGLLAMLASCVTRVEPLPVVSVKVPEQVENGNFVPFQITISRNLVSGDELSLYVNNEVACKVRVTGKVSVNAFSGRVRMTRSGALRAVLTTYGGNHVSVSERVNVSQRGAIPATGVTGNSHKSSVRDDEVLVMFMNDMPRHGYIETATITLADGRVLISGSPILSANPQLAFRTPNSLKQLDVTAVAAPTQ